METAKVFKSGNSQAVRLPKAFRFESEEVYIKRDGENLILIPVKPNWDSLMKSLDQFSTDFFEDERDQGMMEEREDVFV